MVLNRSARLTESLSQPGKADRDTIRSDRKMLSARINKVSGVWFQIGARIMKSLLRFRVQTVLEARKLSGNPPLTHHELADISKRLERADMATAVEAMREDPDYERLSASLDQGLTEDLPNEPENWWQG
jgi:hypothetical protein